MTTYDDVLLAEGHLEALGVDSGHLLLADIITRVVDDIDGLSESEARALVARAFDHLLATGGVDYDSDTGDAYFATLYDEVYNAMEASDLFPEEA